MISSKKPGIIPIFVPHMGCPHDCVFCNQKKITGQQSEIDQEDVIQVIEDHLETMRSKRYPIEIAFFGGSFTGIDVDIQNAYLKIARRYYEDGHIHGIRLSTRPDYINENIVNRLKKFGVTTIELGVQSLNEEVLRASNRGHSKESVYKAVESIKKHNIQLGLQMMLGLPGDSLKTAMQTAREIISLNPDCVRIYPTVVIKETELERLYLENLYTALSVEMAVEWLSEIMPLFSASQIPIIRVGLQPTDDLTSGSAQIAGAYHPSLRQLAVSRIILKRVIAVIDDFCEVNKDQVNDLLIELIAHRKDWTPVRGDKAYNFNSLKEMYPGARFDFVISDDVNRSQVRLTINDEQFCIKID